MLHEATAAFIPYSVSSLSVVLNRSFFLIQQLGTDDRQKKGIFKIKSY